MQMILFIGVASMHGANASLAQTPAPLAGKRVAELASTVTLEYSSPAKTDPVVCISIRNRSKRSVKLCKNVTPGRGLYVLLTSRARRGFEPKERPSNVAGVSKYDFVDLGPGSEMKLRFPWSQFFPDVMSEYRFRFKVRYDIGSLLSFNDAGFDLTFVSPQVEAIAKPGYVVRFSRTPSS
jgi:hypothetical protein